MTKRIALAVLALLVCGCLAWAADETISGTVSDEGCGVKHATPSADAAACVEKCVAGGKKYVLVSKGKVYQLDPQDQLKGMGGKHVSVTGALSGDTITVTSVKAGGHHKKAAAKTS
jgi:hypothetical protein